MKMNGCYLIVVAFTFLNFGNVFTATIPNNKSPIVPTTGQVCKDGKGPLLEGEDSPFPCADECPEGFVCEHPIEGEALGICCPNLDILYDLYGKNSNENENDAELPTHPTTTTTLSTKEVREVHKFANSWQETSEVPEIFTDALPLIDNNADGEKKDTPSPDSHLLKYLKAKELRLSQDKLPIHRSLPNSDPYSNPINPLNPANLQSNNEEQEHNEITEPTSTKQTEPMPAAKQNKTSIRPNCKRQKYERSCEMGEKKTQIVLRWFAKNGECCSYPYGYCPGTLVKDDITLRTKEECETFCLSNSTQIASSFEDGGESPFEMNNEVTVPDSPNVDTVMDGDIGNITPAGAAVDTKLESKTENNEASAAPPYDATTLSFTDLVLSSNVTAPTTASFIDLVLSKNVTAPTTASFIDLVLHTSTATVPEIGFNNKNEISNDVKSESTTPSSTTVITKAIEADKISSSPSHESESNKNLVSEPLPPTPTPPLSTSASSNVVDSESYSNSEASPKSINHPAPANPKFEPLPPTPSPQFPTLANPIQGDVEGGGHELEEVFPPGYGPEIDENNQTRVILHSDIREPISIAPPNEESDAHAKELVSEMSESDPKKDNVAIAPEATATHDSKKEEVLSSPSQMQQQMETQKQPEQTKDGMNKLKNMEEAKEAKNIQNENGSELQILIKHSEGNKRMFMRGGKVQPKKSCLKILPYRSMCPSGMPSQFTLRWFVKAGMCCAYPFGYCHGEQVFNEEAIKTKKECEEFCLGRIDSEKPYFLF